MEAAFLVAGFLGFSHVGGERARLPVKAGDGPVSVHQRLVRRSQLRARRQRLRTGAGALGRCSSGAPSLLLVRVHEVDHLSFRRTLDRRALGRLLGRLLGRSSGGGRKLLGGRRSGDR